MSFARETFRVSILVRSIGDDKAKEKEKKEINQ
jgi:hypothetical protein